MIPLRDANPSRGTPVVTYLLIASCLGAFLYELSRGRDLHEFLLRYGLVPAHYFQAEIRHHLTLWERALPFLTSMFLHGGWLHLIGNMWVLRIFGDNVEGELGHGRYLLFYLCSGVCAALIQLVTEPGSSVPTIGASGAVAGVMGAYFVLYPRAKILAFVPILVFFTLAEIPAYIFLGFWFLLQFFSGTLSLMADGRGFSSVAWWAHIGGFLGGIVLLKLFRRRPLPPGSFEEID